MTSVFAFQASIFKNKLHTQIFYYVRKNTCVLKYVRITQSTYNSIECWCANTKSRIKLYEENLLFSTLMPLISNLTFKLGINHHIAIQTRIQPICQFFKNPSGNSFLNRNKTTYKLQMQGVAGKVPLGQTFEFMSCCQNTIL